MEENTFLISSGSKGPYTINTEIGCCSCPSGLSGAFCKHQFYLMKDKNISFSNAPAITAADKYELAALALGSKCPPPSFFDNFCEENEVEISQIVHPVRHNEKKTTYEDETTASLEDIKTVKDEILRITKLVNVGMTKTSAKRLARNLQQIQDESDFDKLFFFLNLEHIDLLKSSHLP